MAENFAAVWGASPQQLANIRHGAMLHDIGKLSIPDYILDKPGPLDENEWQVVKQHPETARKLLRNLDFLDNEILDIPVYHHERWDGTGYPLGISGGAIPFSARLFAIVDVWESMTHKRAYKDPLSEDVVLEYIAQNAGTQFDPELARFFVFHYAEIKNYGELEPDVLR